MPTDREAKAMQSMATISDVFKERPISINDFISPLLLSRPPSDASRRQI
jgi:hypothetical protein